MLTNGWFKSHIKICDYQMCISMVMFCGKFWDASMGDTMSGQMRYNEWEGFMKLTIFEDLSRLSDVDILYRKGRLPQLVYQHNKHLIDK
jgi:hypothetical protein